MHRGRQRGLLAFGRSSAQDEGSGTSQAARFDLALECRLTRTELRCSGIRANPGLGVTALIPTLFFIHGVLRAEVLLGGSSWPSPQDHFLGARVPVRAGLQVWVGGKSVTLFVIVFGAPRTTPATIGLATHDLPAGPGLANTRCAADSVHRPALFAVRYEQVTHPLSARTTGSNREPAAEALAQSGGTTGRRA